MMDTKGEKRPEITQMTMKLDGLGSYQWGGTSVVLCAAAIRNKCGLEHLKGRYIDLRLCKEPFEGSKPISIRVTFGIMGVHTCITGVVYQLGPEFTGIEDAEGRMYQGVGRALINQLSLTDAEKEAKQKVVTLHWRVDNPDCTRPPKPPTEAGPETPPVPPRDRGW